MLTRDFFVFCTSLKPLELKALGELSQIQHLGDSKIIYSADEPARNFYVINRGMVELLDESSPHGKTIYLSRGDIFGDVETLMGLPRRHRVRTCEFVSLQSFARADFPELIKRVPKFFQYLAVHLASRLEQRLELPPKAENLELTGSLANFDLVTVYQTIVNSSQTGELTILNESEEPICTFFFEHGQPRCGQFLHLTGEEAFWQLFLSEEMPGTFSFSTSERLISDCIQAGRLERQPGDLLINALQGRDEMRDMKDRLPPSTRLQRDQSGFSWPSSAPETLAVVGEQVWEACKRGPALIGDVYHRCSFCELKVYRAVDEMLKAGQLAFAEHKKTGRRLIHK